MKKGEIDLNSYFVQELKRAVFQKKMYLTIAIAFICIWIGAIEEVLFPLPNNAFNLFILSYHFSFLIVISRCWLVCLMLLLIWKTAKRVIFNMHLYV